METTMMTRVWLPIIKTTLFLNLIDVDQIYRPDQQRLLVVADRHSVEITKSLQVKKTPSAFKALVWVKCTFVVYFSLKGIALTAVELLKLSAWFNKSPSTRSNWNKNYFVLQLKYIEQVLGNPLGSLGDISFIFYFQYSISALVLTVLTTFYRYMIDPFNVPDMRLMFDADREFKRIDYRIREKLECFDRSILAYYSVGFKKLEKYQLAPKQKQQFQDKWMLIQRSREHLEKFRGNPAKFRPINYSLDSVQASRRNFALIFGSGLLSTILASALIVLPAIAERFWTVCAEYDGPPNCRLTEKSSTRSKLFWIETVAIIWACSYAYVAYTTLFVLILSVQHGLISSFKSNAMNCLNELRGYQLIEMTRRASMPLSAAESHLLLMRENSMSGSNKKDDALERLFLDTIIRLLIIRDEIELGFRNLISIITPHVIIAVPIAIISISMEFVGERSLMLKASIIVCWLLANCLAFSYAFLHAEFVRIEKIYWSIVAENINRINGNQFKGYTDFLSDLWHKINYLSHLRLCDSSGTGFTFKSIIESNFLVISTYSLIQRGLGG